jgi:hypothetical protein
MTKDGFFKKYGYVYDGYYDCYICPGNKTLTYCTTNRTGCSERESWFSIYADVWKSPDGNEGLVDFCMHESEEVSKNQSKKGITEYGKSVKKFYFGCDWIFERKMALSVYPRAALSTV